MILRIEEIEKKVWEEEKTFSDETGWHPSH